MKFSFLIPGSAKLFFLLLVAILCVEQTFAATSPYVTQELNVPLNQAADDSVNGILPLFSHATVEGPGSRVSDATSATAPTSNVILGPDNEWVGVTWDFGEPNPGFVWKLERFDAWISGQDNVRKGYRADLSVSVSGLVNDFSIISNTFHWQGLTQNEQFNHVRYDFPDRFIAGSTNTMDRYPARGFRYLRFNSRGDRLNNVDWQSRFVELDVWVTQVLPPFDSVARDENGDVTLSWTTVIDRTYQIEYKEDLNDANWLFLTSVFADEQTKTYVDTGTSGAKRFYKLVLLP